MPDNQELNDLLRDMRCEVVWTDKATMPIPLYERMKTAIKQLAGQEPPSKELELKGDLRDKRTHCCQCGQELAYPSHTRMICLDCEYPTLPASDTKEELKRKLTATQQALDSAVEALQSIVNHNAPDNSHCWICKMDKGHSITCPVNIARAALASIKE